MASLYIDRKGISIKADGDALAFYEKGKRFQTVPLKLVDRIVMHTDVELNSTLIAKLCSMKIGLQVISGRCSHTSAIMYTPHNDARRRLMQYRYFDNEILSLNESKETVSTKLQGELVNIEKIKKLYKVKASVKAMVRSISSLLNKVDEAQSIDSLRGIEGNAALQYFGALEHLLPKVLNFHGREKQPPKDPFNSVISFTYMIVKGEIVNDLYAAGLDPFIGFMHTIDYGRESLAWDLLEYLRADADMFAAKLFADRILNKDMFSISEKGCLMSHEARASFYREYEAYAPVLRLKIRELISSLLSRILGSSLKEFDIVETKPYAA